MSDTRTKSVELSRKRTDLLVLGLVDAIVIVVAILVRVRVDEIGRRARNVGTVVVVDVAVAVAVVGSISSIVKVGDEGRGRRMRRCRKWVGRRRSEGERKVRERSRGAETWSRHGRGGREGERIDGGIEVTEGGGRTESKERRIRSVAVVVVLVLKIEALLSRWRNR